MRRIQLCVAACAALAPLLLATASASAQAPVPCSSIGGGRYDCQWYPPGDGRSGGALVVSDRTTVGFLHQGTNWIVCQQQGGTVFNSRGYRNHWFGFTTADNGRTGWASAIEASGGDDFGPFGGGVPNCNGTQPGLPTWSGEWGRPPAPPANPSPTPTPTPAPGSPPPPAAAPGYLLATVSNTWEVTRRWTRLERLQVRGAPAGASVGLACLRHRCRLRSRSATADARGFASLTRMFRARTIRRGTVIEVRITAPGLIGKVVRYRIHRGHIPQGQVLCLTPGAASPQRC